MILPEGHIDEATARIEIDQKLEAAGWFIQGKKRLNLYSGLGVAVHLIQGLKAISSDRNVING